MYSVTSSRFVKLGLLGLLAACFSSGLLRAQGSLVSEGKFTLPVETQWGLATLPPGDYSYELQSMDLHNIVTVRGNGKTVMIMPNGIAQHQISDRSSLTLIRTGQKALVRSFDVGHLGETFSYKLPKGAPVLAAQKPELIQRISVLAATK